MDRSTDAERREKLFQEAAALERELDDLREKGVGEEGIAAFRRLYPQFKAIFKWEE